MRIGIMALAVTIFLCGCSADSGVATPEQFAGTWASDCSEPFVSFDGGEIHVFPDKATYQLTSASLEGSDLKVGYETPQGSITETYVVAGDTLRLASGNYGGTEATWQKNPMKKCS